MIGYGATFQPTSTAASVFSWPPAYQANPGVFQIGQTFSYLISTTAVGNNVVNTINHSDAGNITPGEMIVITSIYGFIGYSPFQFEYARVTGVDAFTGAVTLDRNVKWVHRSDFPDYDGVFDLGQPYGNCYFGKARIWRLTQQGYSFDLDHIYEGFSVLPTINNSPNYQVSTGRKITWLNNPTIVGASPSWAEEVTYKHCGFVSGEEPDKMVDRIVFEDCVVPYIDFQSPVNRVEFRNCQCGNLNTGAAKILTVDGCDVGQLSSAILFATSSAVTVKNSFVRSYYGGPRSSNAVTIDGVNVWFGVNGVGIITVVKQWIPSDQAYLLVNLNTIPGMWVSLGGYPECNLGTGIIQYVTEDSTKFYIHTTLPYSTIPSWGNNTITFGRTGAQRYYNITGCDAARTLHLATELGCEPWEVTYQNMAGNPSFDLHPPGGVIQKIEINVMVASTSASTMLIYVYFWSYANPGGAQIHSTLTINTGIAGRRTLTQGITSPGITGFKSGDSWIYDGGAAITAIPGDICFSMSGGFTPGNSLVGALVVVDCGLFAKPFTGTQLGIVTGEAR
jgi:hypothetical protein